MSATSRTGAASTGTEANETRTGVETARMKDRDQDPQDDRRPESLEPFVRGCAWPAGGEMTYPRCDPGPGGLRLPADTRAAAALPVGVRFEFETAAREVALSYRTETDDLGYRGPGAGTRFVTYRGGRRVGSLEAELGRGGGRISLGEGEGSLVLYLPEGMRPSVLGLEGIGDSLRPRSPEPRWLCYGDSIAEGWCASEPASAWPQLVARDHALDTVNLGYAGAARGEIASAEELAALPADGIVIAHGTNCWSRTPQSADLFAENLRAFLSIVREGQPDTPIVAISPILRMDAEEAANRLGARLSDLRAAFEAVVAEHIAGGDALISLVEGAALVPAERLPDGIHPDDLGHRQMAAAIGPVMAGATAQRVRARLAD